MAVTIKKRMKARVCSDILFRTFPCTKFMWRILKDISRRVLCWFRRIIRYACVQLRKLRSFFMLCILVFNLTLDSMRTEKSPREKMRHTLSKDCISVHVVNWKQSTSYNQVIKVYLSGFVDKKQPFNFRAYDHIMLKHRFPYDHRS